MMIQVSHKSFLVENGPVYIYIRPDRLPVTGLRNSYQEREGRREGEGWGRKLDVMQAFSPIESLSSYAAQCTCMFTQYSTVLAVQGRDYKIILTLKGENLLIWKMDFFNSICLKGLSSKNWKRQKACHRWVFREYWGNDIFCNFKGPHSLIQ